MTYVIENSTRGIVLNDFPLSGELYLRSNPGGRPGNGGGNTGSGGNYDQPYREWTTDPTGGGRPIVPQGPTYPLRQDHGIGYGNDGGHRDGPDTNGSRGSRGSS